MRNYKFFKIHYMFDNLKKEGKWLIVGRETNRHNWSFVGETTNPSDAFNMIPATAGIDRTVVFKIEKRND